MLTKCMLTPLKLARLIEWNGRLGKPSAIMAIDITNDKIGIALAYHRQMKSKNETSSPGQSDAGGNVCDGEKRGATVSTSITALPPIPYMSREPYHPSYAFLHHNRPGDETARSLDRVDRTLAVADQLADLALARGVDGILVRWPGDLASAASDGKDEESTREIEEGQLLFPTNRSSGDSAGDRNAKSDGCMGYLRGRIMFVLDKCCTGHGHNKKNVPSGAFILEGSRPFALWDTSRSEKDWIVYKHESKYPKPDRPLDKYGNSLTEMDLWGRAAIFGNQPPPPKQGKFYYSSKQYYPGYYVSSQFGLRSSVDDVASRNPHLSYENFDSLHDGDSRLNQFRGSLSAMHALYDFVDNNLQGRIALPLWVSTPTSSVDNTRAMLSIEGNFLGSKNQIGEAKSAVPKKPSGLATLAQVPIRKARRKSRN